MMAIQRTLGIKLVRTISIHMMAVFNSDIVPRFVQLVPLQLLAGWPLRQDVRENAWFQLLWLFA